MPETVDKKLKSCLKKPSAKPPKKPTATKKSPFDYPIASATPIHERFQDGRTVSSRIKPPEKLAQDSGIDCAIASGTPTKERPKLRRNPSSRTKKPAIKTTARPQQKGRKVSFPEPKGGTGQAKHPARNLQGSANDPAEYDSKLPPRKPVIPGHEANCNCYQCGGLFGIDTEQQQNPSSLQKQNSVNDDLEIMVGQSNHVPTVAGRWAEDDPIRMPGHGRDCVCHQCDRLLFRKLVGREPMPQPKKDSDLIALDNIKEEYRRGLDNWTRLEIRKYCHHPDSNMKYYPNPPLDGTKVWAPGEWQADQTLMRKRVHESRIILDDVEQLAQAKSQQMRMELNKSKVHSESHPAPIPSRLWHGGKWPLPPTDEQIQVHMDAIQRGIEDRKYVGVSNKHWKWVRDY